MEYTAIKNCYRHYLASYRSVNETENVSQIVQNLNTVSETLHSLRVQQQDLDKKLSDEKSKIVTQTETDALRAIMLFNADRRFSITE